MVVLSSFQSVDSNRFVRMYDSSSMDSEILRYFVDPVKGKILLEINNAGSASVRYLCEKCPDIPRSTMYRHLAKLEKTGLLEVVSTRRVRGTIEKTYRFVSEKFVPSGDDYSKEAVLGLFIQYWMRFYDEFERNIPDMLSRDKPIPMSFTNEFPSERTITLRQDSFSGDLWAFWVSLPPVDSCAVCPSASWVSRVPADSS